MPSYSVFIGRFQPVHEGHLQVIREALQKTDELIIILGSHNKSRNCRNPFNSEERREMIRLSCEDVGLDYDRIHVMAVEDHSYNLNRWIEAVQAAVNAIIWRKWQPDPTPISLIGHKKDHSSFYLDLFPNWTSLAVENFKAINATDIRNDMFEDMLYEDNILHGKDVTEKTYQFIDKWSKTVPAKILQEEYEMIKKYKESWTPNGTKTFFDAKGNPVQVQVGPPYPATFMTTDAVVTQAGHVLMVTRGAAPGKGLLALPGGFLNEYESLEDGMLRELREETKIDVPDKVLRGCIKWRNTFDDPYRSSRGRTITHAYHIDLGAKGKLPKVKGSDDAIKAQWVPMNDLNGNFIFEDHLQIIRHMTGI